MLIDFRSDTVTRPTSEMLESMHGAKVGDSIFGDDPTMTELERYAAELFGMDGALFCPSGTMTNQIAIKVHTVPGDQLICDQTAHVYMYEGGGAALHSGISCKLLDGDRGRFTAEQVESAIQRDDPHFPRTRLVSVENSSNKGGGTCWQKSEILRIKEVCDRRGLGLHLDGARLFNALAETKESPAEYGEIFDSISICLSKGLGAPVGSLLLGGKEFIASADRMRKVFGGGMRQTGYLAAAGLYALENHVERLNIDHQQAKRLGEAFAASRLPGKAQTVETNIVLFEFETPEALIAATEGFADNEILVASMSDRLLRLVTHHDVTPSMIDRTVEVIGDL